MRFLFIGTSLLFISQFSNAQIGSTANDTSRYLPDSATWGTTVNVTGLIGALAATPRTLGTGQQAFMLRYYRSPKFVLRLGLAPALGSVKVQQTDSVGKDLVEYDSTARQNRFAIQPGVEFHLKGSRRLDPYVAVDADLGFIGGFRAGSNTRITDTTGTATFNRTITQAGGFSAGLKISSGMNYFIAKRFSLGAEYGLGASVSVIGGDYQNVLQAEPVSGSAYTTRVQSSARTTTYSLVVDPTVKLTLSYFFGG